jgi:hypothetical protein
MNPNKIGCMVGDEQLLVDYDLFLDVHERLADHFRRAGLRGYQLDVAICADLPRALAEILGGTFSTRH